MTLSFERLHTGIDDDVGYYVFFFTGWQDVGGGRLFLIRIAKPTITAVKSNNSAIGEIYQTLDNKTPT